MTVRSYPSLKVRSGGPEELPHLQDQGQWSRGATTPEVRGGSLEELPQALGQGRWPRGATPPPKSGCCGAQEG